MESTEILLGLLSAIVSASWVATQIRLGRMEKQLADKADRTELTALREEMNRGFSGLREEIKAGDAALREEMNRGFTAIRSDITQIALAVGAGRPKATEG